MTTPGNELLGDAWRRRMFRSSSDVLEETAGERQFGAGDFGILSGPLQFSQLDALVDLVSALRQEAPQVFREAVELSKPYVAEVRRRLLETQEPEPDIHAVFDAYAKLRATDMGNPLLMDWNQTFLEEARFPTADHFDSELHDALKQSVAEWAVKWRLDHESAEVFVALVFLDAVGLAVKEVTGTEFSEEWELQDRFITFKRAGLIQTPLASPLSVDEWLEYEPESVTIHVPTFEPGFETQRGYRESALAEAARVIDEHIASTLASPSMKHRPKSPRKRRTSQHLRWFIRYQVLNESLDTVAESNSGSIRGSQAVWLALREVSDLTGIELREGNKGGKSSTQPPFNS